MQNLSFAIIIRKLTGLLLIGSMFFLVQACARRAYYPPPPPAEASYTPIPSKPDLSARTPSSPPGIPYPPARTLPSYPPTRTPSPPAGTPAPSIPSYAPKPPSRAHVAEKCLINLDSRKTVVHEVGPLETIWRIAKMYDVTEESICQANRLKPRDPISIGQKLTIPGAKEMRHVISLYPNSQWKYIIIHHTATDIGKAAMINRNHQDRGFWHGLGYHFLIDNGTMGKGDGQIEVAPRWIKQQSGAHCKAGGMNERGIGIALVGNFSQDSPTPSQLDSLAYLLKTLCTYYKIPAYSVKGHRDVDGASTECPGTRFPWPSVRQCLSTF